MQLGFLVLYKQSTTNSQILYSQILMGNYGIDDLSGKC